LGFYRSFRGLNVTDVIFYPLLSAKSQITGSARGPFSNWIHAAEGVTSEKRGLLDPIIEVLAFFASMRKYSYVDMLGNALDKVTALEAVSNAVRDFYSNCLDAPPVRRLEEGVTCPRIDRDSLERSIEAFKAIVFKSSSGDLVRFVREIALSALARAPRFRGEASSG